jgi:MinD-like ATPase involved in chromosome partitioning or flagellar assembly
VTGPLRVLVLAPDRPASAAVPGLELHTCADLPDLLGRAGAGAADAALISPRVAGVDAVAVARLRALACPPLALVSAAGDVDLAHRIGLTDCIALPVDPQVLQSVLAQEAPTAAANAGPRDGRVIAVWGPPGSPGRSTVVALLAVGAQRAGNSVAIIDADMAAPQWGLLADGPITGSGLIVASRRAAAGRADVSDLMQPLGPAISLLGFAPEPDRWVEVAPSGAAAVLDATASLADVVLVDLPADIRAAHPAYDIGWAHDAAAFPRAVLAAADEVVAVLAADPLGVHRFAAWWPMLLGQAEPDVLVANRVGMARGGRRPREQLEAVIGAIGSAAPVVEVPWEPKAADGLLDIHWAAARGWRRTPEELWRTVAEVPERRFPGAGAQPAAQR